MTYKIISQIGDGKEGKTYLVEDDKHNKYAMKTFKKTKSVTKLNKEADIQRKAAQKGIAPKIVEVNEKDKYIVMDLLDRTLYDYMKERNGDIALKYQKQMIKIFEKLDEAKILHGDPSPLNFMFKKNKLYIIDFGFSKDITPKLVKEHGTDKLNMKYMPVGFILKVRQVADNTKFSHLEKYTHGLIQT